MKPTNYAARAWLLKNRQRLEAAKMQTEKSTTEIMTDDDSPSLNPHLFEALNGEWGRIYP